MRQQHLFFRIILFLIILFSVVYRSGRFLGIDPYDEKKEPPIASFTPEDIRSIFPTYTRIELLEVSVFAVYSENEKLGTLLNSSPKSDSIIGYVNAVPLLVGVDSENRVLGVRLLPNKESHDFMNEEIDRMIEKWKGWSPQAPFPQPDGVSGATFSSNAVQRTIRHTLSEYYQQVQQQERSWDWRETLKTFAALIVIILALVVYWNPARMRKYRDILLILNLLILGFWVGDSLSFQSIYNWMVDGIHWKERWLMGLLFLLAITLPFFTQKAFYCTYVCPYGSAQELVSKINRKHKIKITPRAYTLLRMIREILFGGLLLLLFSGIAFDLTGIEPFAAFVYQRASWWVITLALAFLFLSLFIAKPWCHFFCPTGQFLEIIRKLRIVKATPRDEKK